MDKISRYLKLMLTLTLGGVAYGSALPAQSVGLRVGIAVQNTLGSSQDWIGVASFKMTNKAARTVITHEIFEKRGIHMTLFGTRGVFFVWVHREDWDKVRVLLRSLKQKDHRLEGVLVD